MSARNLTPQALWTKDPRVPRPMQQRPITDSLLRERLLRLAVNDWITLAYLLGLNLAWWLASPSPELRRVGPVVLLLLIGFVGLVIVFARRTARGGFWTALCYRVGHFGGLQLSYLSFKAFLPAVNPGSLDQELLEFDLAVFGSEPAMAMNAWVSSFSTEWFSFFYYSYFFLLASHIFPIILFGRDHQLLSEFALGMTIVTAVGQTCYMLVPGFGPYTMPEAFSEPLPNGLWWTLVTDLVARGGAQKDIFPSLHTALPTFILLFSFHNRSLYPYRFSWPVIGLATVNIIIATMFLRWHYLIDVVAGLCLATFAYVAAVRVTAWETRRRALLGLGRVWPSWNGDGQVLFREAAAHRPS